MTDKEYQKMVADTRRSVSRKYGFRQSSYINFKVEGGYFFCLYFLTGEAKLTVKPMYADDLWWDIWDASENKMEPLSLRGTGAYSLPGQVLASYDIPNTTNQSELTNIIEQVFQDSATIISKFLTDNPDADIFYPDESRMDHDPDRLLYLITLIHNDKKDEVLDIIKEARKSKHCCMFKSGMFSDSYTYILRWCKREQTVMRIWNTFVSIFSNFVKTRAYALMALSNNKESTFPSILDVRLFDGSVVSALFVSLVFLCDNLIFIGIISVVAYLIFPFFVDFSESSTRYYILFGRLSRKIRLRWEISIWAIVISLYLYAFAILYFQIHN